MRGLVQRAGLGNKQKMKLPGPVDAVIRFALPARCAGCGQVQAQDDSLCMTCWMSLDFLPSEGCAACGVPMAQAGLVCGRCLAEPPLHDGVRAPVAYAGLARDLAVRLKHGRKLGLARLMGKAMARVAPQAAGQVIIPVPLHRWRIWRRSFNQSVALGRVIARETGLQLESAWLIRTKQTPMLGPLSRRQRARAVAGAFAVLPQHRAGVAGQHILLIDDVHTSGATVNGCARALKRAGAASVTVLCWARVLFDRVEDD